jgi:hypothetical protein
MKSIDELVSAPAEAQEKWLDENYPDLKFGEYIDLGVLLRGLESKIEEYIEDSDSYETGHMISGSDVRAEEINKGAKITEDERRALGQAIIRSEVENIGGMSIIYICVAVEFSFNEENLCSIYIGMIEGQGGYMPHFFGVFQTLSDGVALLKKENGIYMEEKELLSDEPIWW